MKISKTKTKKIGKKFCVILVIAQVAIGVTLFTEFKLTNLANKVLANQIDKYDMTFDQADINVTRKERPGKEYKYNDQVPEVVILREMKLLSERFNIDYDKWKTLVKCEANCTEYNNNRHGCIDNEIDNLAENPGSTAVGVGQYLIATWRATESWKQFKCARTDYRCALWEMALDLQAGEQGKWQECLDKKGLNF